MTNHNRYTSKTRNINMNCKDMKYLVSSYMDGEVTIDEKAMVESHIAACGRCKEMHKHFCRTDRFILSDTQVVVPENFEARIMERIERQQGVQRESIFDLISIEKQLLAVLTALCVIASVAVLNVSSSAPSKELQSYLSGGGYASGKPVVSGGSSEMENMMAYLLNTGGRGLNP